MTSFGFIVYYFIPLAFINGNLSLALFLLMLILLMVIIGLVFMSTLFFTVLEKAVLWVTLNTCCRRDRRLYPIIIRNMQGHQRRNNKTSVMITLATSFLIYAQSSFKTISTMIKDVSYQLIGSDILVYSPKSFLDEIPIKQFLEI